MKLLDGCKLCIIGAISNLSMPGALGGEGRRCCKCICVESDSTDEGNGTLCMVRGCFHGGAGCLRRGECDLASYSDCARIYAGCGGEHCSGLVGWIGGLFVCCGTVLHHRQCCDGRQPHKKLPAQQFISGTGPWLHSSRFDSSPFHHLGRPLLPRSPAGPCSLRLAGAAHGPPGAPRKIPGAGRRLLGSLGMFHVQFLDIRRAGGQCDLHVFDGRGGVRRVQLAGNRRAEQRLHHLQHLLVIVGHGSCSNTHVHCGWNVAFQPHLRLCSRQPPSQGGGRGEAA